MRDGEIHFQHDTDHSPVKLVKISFENKYLKPQKMVLMANSKWQNRYLRKFTPQIGKKGKSVWYLN